jgi:hypothetical protein
MISMSALLEATSGPSGIARLDQSPIEFGSLRVLIHKTKGLTMRASYLVANRLPAFSAERHLSTREGDKEANRPFFREGKSINENNPLVCVIDDDSSCPGKPELSAPLREAEGTDILFGTRVFGQAA